MNLYIGMAGDPVNRRDPFGLDARDIDRYRLIRQDGLDNETPGITVTGTRPRLPQISFSVISTPGPIGSPGGAQEFTGLGESTQSQESSICRSGAATVHQIAALPPGAISRGFVGETIGNNPLVNYRYKRVNTDLPGDEKNAYQYFGIISAAAGDRFTIPIPGFGVIGFPSMVRLRTSDNDLDLRIEIPKGTFSLNAKETIHVRKGGEQCKVVKPFGT